MSGVAHEGSILFNRYLGLRDRESRAYPHRMLWGIGESFLAFSRAHQKVPWRNHDHFRATFAFLEGTLLRLSRVHCQEAKNNDRSGGEVAKHLNHSISCERY